MAESTPPVESTDQDHWLGAVMPDASMEKPSKMFGLIIGINEYQTYDKLEGAVADATAFMEYLLNDLSVPEDQIIILRDSQASRARIIQSFEALGTNPHIMCGDPIVIYYAGHGANIQAPAGWEAGRSTIQALVPQDTGTIGGNDQLIFPLPDRTISSLLSKIAERKGDNITVIFDCCHSTSGTRGDHNFTGRRARCIDMKNFPVPPKDLDLDILGANSRGTADAERFFYRGMHSHLLLAACGSDELAYETNGRGDFTCAFLKVLRTWGADNLTYKGCIQRFPSLPKQNPQCEGYNINRILFNAKCATASNTFILTERQNDNYILKAGAAQGITAGMIFDLHRDHISTPDNPSFGKMRVINTHPFTSTLVLLSSSGTSTMSLPSIAYARQSNSLAAQELNVYCSRLFLDTINATLWHKALLTGGSDLAFKLVDSEDAAQLIVDVNQKGEVTFQSKHTLVNAGGIVHLPYTVPVHPEDVLSVLRSAAWWHWHVDRTNPDRPFANEIQVEFLRLVEDYTQFDSEGYPITKVDGPDLNLTGVVRIVVKPDDLYGINIINKSSTDLYPYLFYFDASSLSAEPHFLGSIGSAKSDSPLPAHSTLPIGYGSSGQTPLAFRLPGDSNIDIGILKMFVTTSPTDFAALEQHSPFEGMRGFNRVPRGDGVRELRSEELWDTMMLVVVQQRL